MKIGIYSDPHITRKISYLPDRSDNILDTFIEIYNRFKYERVDLVVCCGDLFDRSRLLAIDTDLVCEVIKVMSTVRTYVLSGNHDMGDTRSSLIDILELVPNILPVSISSSMDIVESGVQLVFVPYGQGLPDTDISTDSIVFTHDEYAGMTINSLGSKSKSDRNISDDFPIIFNGHIHIPGIYGNIINVGSVLPSKFGEMVFGDSPHIYIYDTDSKKVNTYDLMKPYRFYIIDQDHISDLDIISNSSSTCIRIDYTDDKFYDRYSRSDLLNKFKYMTFRKIIPESSTVSTSISVRSEIQRVDVPSFMSLRVSNDKTLSDEMKNSIINEFPIILVEEE